MRLEDILGMGSDLDTSSTTNLYTDKRVDPRQRVSESVLSRQAGDPFGALAQALAGYHLGGASRQREAQKQALLNEAITKDRQFSESVGRILQEHDKKGLSEAHTKNVLMSMYAKTNDKRYMDIANNIKAESEKDNPLDTEIRRLADYDKMMTGSPDFETYDQNKDVVRQQLVTKINDLFGQTYPGAPRQQATPDSLEALGQQAAPKLEAPAMPETGVSKQVRQGRVAKTRGGASMIENQNKRTEKLITKLTDSYVTRETIANVEDSLTRLSSGLYGKVGRGFAKNLAPDSPGLEDYQNVKSFLTDVTLGKMEKLKGAASERDMQILQAAAADDELLSSPRVMSVIKNLVRKLDADDTAIMSSYKRLYGEDPTDWEEVKTLMEKMQNRPDPMEKLKALNPYSKITDEQRAEYNALRESGMSKEEARKKVGF